MTSRWVGLYPLLTAGLYPLFLMLFHAAVGAPGTPVSGAGLIGAIVALAAAIAAPLSCLWWVWRHRDRRGGFDIAARRMAFLALAAPPLYVFLGVFLSILHAPVPELPLWLAGWIGLAAVLMFAPHDISGARPAPPRAGLRVIHGVTAVILLLYVAFHLTNHLFALAGPEAHTAMMKAGRLVYRQAFVEPVLVAAILFQVATGLSLAFRWSALPLNFPRVFQLGSGVYIAVFVLVHMNSVFVSARLLQKIDTGWAFATGAPTGLIHDAWNIRLVPHYFLGVVFILGHLATGARQVALAHGMNARLADRLWIAGLVAGVLVGAAILAGMCGLRL